MMQFGLLFQADIPVHHSAISEDNRPGLFILNQQCAFNNSYQR
jgi:hypothetical protein